LRLAEEEIDGMAQEILDAHAVELDAEEREHRRDYDRREE
jgi:hypothetical protein